MIKPLTKKQLKVYFEDYRTAFPDWSVEHEVVLVRSRWPLVQRISFEALRSGAYRPSCSVEAAIVPGVRILHRFLDVKHRQVNPLGHASRWRGVVAAMEEQFQPPIRTPLEVAEVLQLAEEEVSRDKIDNPNHFSVLAALNGFTGDTKRAAWWCTRVEDWMTRAETPVWDWALQRARYTRGLWKAIEEGRQSEFFETVSSGRQ